MQISMSYLGELHTKIKEKSANVAVIGLGYVGLPVACVLASKGFNVIGVDLKKDRVEMINAKSNPIEGKEPGLQTLLQEVVNNKSLIATTKYDQLKAVDIFLIDVETPIDEHHVPQYKALRSACERLGPVIKDGALVIVESTIAPGTIDKIVRPLLEKTSGKKSKTDFFIGTCPERVMPGKLLANLRSMSRVCGGELPEVAELMVSFYRHVVDADLDEADTITAELTKTAENAYRDVNIAFANELALICQSVGADFLKVRNLVNKSPGRSVLFAGGGVGGHCIPKDPWLLAYGAESKVDLRLIPASRAVNDSMPVAIGEMTIQALREHDLPIKNAKVAILGYAYLEESDDTRNSPSKVLFEYLKSKGAKVVIHDPYVSGYQEPIEKVVDACDAVIIMVAHQVYREMDIRDLKKALVHSILIDGRRVIDPVEAAAVGFKYYGIGYGVV